MNFSSHSDNPVHYASTVRIQSDVMPGVSYTVYRMSFARRMELLRMIRDVGAKLNYLEASHDFVEKVEANLLSQSIDELYLKWGLVAVHSLSIDGEPASSGSLLANGPDELAREIVEAIKAQCGLSEEERKN